MTIEQRIAELPQSWREPQVVIGLEEEKLALRRANEQFDANKVVNERLEALRASRAGAMITSLEEYAGSMLDSLATEALENAGVPIVREWPTEEWLLKAAKENEQSRPIMRLLPPALNSLTGIWSRDINVQVALPSPNPMMSKSILVKIGQHDVRIDGLFTGDEIPLGWFENDTEKAIRQFEYGVAKAVLYPKFKNYNERKRNPDTF